MNTNLESIIRYLKALQNTICNALETIDGKATFIEDAWDRSEGGGGLSRVIQNGNVFEKGGVNFSHVHGKLPEVMKSETRSAQYFHATGVSIVIHPQNPYVPIIHMNVRYFCMSNTPDGEIVDEWFGGGIDLSPAYPNETDTQYLHQTLKTACDKFDITFYPKFKTWCDEYFTIKHRKEMRGVGGIFYDHLRPTDAADKHKLFLFMQAIGDSFIPIYAKIVKHNYNKTYTAKNKEWQYIRRGRYAEFNLVYDRGTHFGLKTDGRIESILMSLPPEAAWKYNYHPIVESEEEKTLKFFQPQNWVN